MEHDELEDTDERPQPALSDTAPFVIPARETLIVKCGAATHCGRVRPQNEDHYAIVRRRRWREIVATNVPLDALAAPEDEAYVLIVADGVRGEGFGDLASQLAVRAGWEAGGRAASWLMRLEGVDTQEVHRRVQAAAKAIQQAFLTYYRDHPGSFGMATTWTCAYLVDWDVVVAHVGDSRAYHCYDGQAKQITSDHTLAEDLRRSGANPDETQRYRSVLTKAFGGSAGEEVVPDVHEIRLDHGHGVLVCSDGLTNTVSDHEIARVVLGHDEPQAACDTLVNLALQRGAPDNVTVVLARVFRREPATAQ
jgi:PPM family protein phosphatase